MKSVSFVVKNLPKLQPNSAWAQLQLFDRTGWQRLAFGDFAASIGERAEPRDAQEEIYVGLEHLDPQSLHIRRWGKGSDVTGTKLRFRKGDIIFGKRRAYQRKLAVAEFGGICSAHAMVIRARPDKVLPEFLPFLMMSDRFMNRAVEISVGSLSPTINWKTLKLETFDLPPVDQQRRIAEILWAVDEAEQANTQLESEIRDFSAALTADTISRFKSSEVRLGDRVRVQGGFAFKSEDLCEQGVRLLKIANVQPGRIDWSETTHLPESFLTKHSRFALKESDYLIALTRPIIGNGLKVSRTGKVDVPALLNQRVARFEFVDSHTDEAYFYGILGSCYFREEVEKRMLTSNQPNISTSEIENIPVPFPSIERQKSIGEQLARSDVALGLLSENRTAGRNLIQTIISLIINDNSHDV